MPTATMLDQATSMIEKAWGQPIEILEALAVRRPIEDPLLRSAMSAHAGLAITENSVSAHHKRLHALTRPGYVPTFYELPQITSSAADLRLAHAEGRTQLQAIRRLVEAREGTMPPDQSPAARQAQAAVARSGHAPQSPAQVVPDQPSPAAAAGPPAPAAGPRR
ncbi:hypothetical protein KQH42_28165 [Streptomyces sp. CHA1]|uniref:hypothetical protein n=1 Tax=Streptomyces TaxID=1883 RepID=UPI001BFC02D4|nr:MULTISPECIES: hypothetical protein [unclassified Streptomyces]MBT3160148.1 hypothetical protein [Streptomyces sp. G11C]MCO6704300.1 hypothetical protein [Streptomyces sp. CHB9.2]MCO6710570.1 hypothetical protein [Streptomyces sp. CHA3]MCO6716370.1 hypothetical protein [Streptomyces sp. CHB19.2]MCO6722501.1 hypothetical protein [Streptomyces sp. Vc714c-19]